MASSMILSPSSPMSTLVSSTVINVPSSLQQHPLLSKKKHSKLPNHVSTVACSRGNQSNTTPPSPNSNGSTEQPHNNIGGASGLGHRRDVLIGLGGLCGGVASTLINNNPNFAARAAPVFPDFENCGKAVIPHCGKPPFNCCPPPSDSKLITDFRPPLAIHEPRVRKAAHLVSSEELCNYQRALKIMKSLPDTDPRSFMNQANIHCAYCQGAYNEVGVLPRLQLQVHDSWLFFPFHRWYLYFYERILGSLINDPLFAIPFWNYDSPGEGMQMPSIFNDPNSPLYDPLRNSYHVPPNIINLGFDPQGECQQGNEDDNLSIMFNQVITNGKSPEDFLGRAYRAGEKSTSLGGSVENTPHGPVHLWTSDRNQPNGEDMGNFYSAGRDPIFYAHHANIDRIWSVWKTKLGGSDFSDQDWLKSGFVFYNETKDLVRVRVEDCLNTMNLGYIYQDVDNPWTDPKYKPKNLKPKALRLELKAKLKAKRLIIPFTLLLRNDDIQFPLALNDVVTIKVKRPKKEKEEAEEVLIIEGIDYDNERPVKFDVIINEEEDYKLVKARNTEFAGSFVRVPHSGMNMKTGLRLALTSLLEDLGAENDDIVLVTLVPRIGKNVKIDGIKIELK